MKKLLTIFSFLVCLLPSVYAVDCMVEATEHKIGTNTSFTYGPMTYGTTKMSIDIKKSNSGLGTVYIETSPDNSSYTQRLALQYNELGSSYHTYTFNTSTSDRYVKMRVSGGTLSKWYANLKSIEVFNLSTTSIDFGNVVVGQSAQQTFTINWQQRGGAITSNNGKFTLSDASFGSTNCGANGTKTVTVTFTPTAIGAQNGTITVDGATITVTGVGTIPAPTGLTNTDLKNTTASFSWNAVTGATGYRLINKTTGATKDVSGTSTTVTDLTPDTNYNFAVVALNGSTPSSESNVVNVTTLFYDPTRCIFQHIKGPIAYRDGTSYNVTFAEGTTSPFNITVAYELANSSITGSGYYTWIKYSKNGKTQSGHINEVQIKTLPNEPTYQKFSETIIDTDVTGFKFESDHGSKDCYLKNLVVYYTPGISSSNVDLGTVVSGSTTNGTIVVNYANTATLTATKTAGANGFNIGSFTAPSSCQVGTINIPFTYTANDGAGVKTATIQLSNGQTTTITLTATVSLAPPTGLAVTGTTNTAVSLSWNKVTGASGYRIKNVTTGATYDVSGENTTTYTWGSLNADTDYTFTVMTLLNGTPSSESASVTGHTLFYDPTRCVALADGGVYSYNSGSGGEKNYSFVGSPFGVSVYYELERADGMTSGRTSQNNYRTSDNVWHDGVNVIGRDEVKIEGYTKFGPFTFPANTDIIQFDTDASKNFYVKNFVAYYIAGVSADVSSIDYGTVAPNAAAIEKTITITYANATPLTASVTGEGFTIGTLSSTVNCGIGTTTLKVTFTPQAAWEGTVKTGKVTLSNGATAEVNLQATVALAKVQNFAVSSTTNNSIALSWTAGTYAEKYEITVNGNTTTVNAPATTYTYTGLEPNTSYTYSIVAVRGSQKSEASQVTGTTKLAAPTNLSATPSYTSVQLDWTAVAGATSYIVRRAGVADITVNTNTCNVTGLDPFTDYSFTVVSVKDGVEQSSANTSTKTLKLPAATNFAASNVSTTGMTLSWDAVTSATGYKLVNKTLGTSQTVTGTSVNLTGLTVDTQYQFELVTMYGAAEQEKTSTLTQSTSKLPAPSDITTTAGTNSIEFNWTPVSGADKYIIKNTETGTEYEVNNLPYTITGLDPNTTYNYEVYSYKDGKKQNKTTVSPVTTNKLPAATNFAASNISTTGMTLSWDAVTSATGYKLVNTTTGDTLTVTGTSTNVTGLSANTEYEFELITMFNDDEQNKTSLTQKTLLPAPTNLTATPSYTSVQLDWTAVEGATSYIVRRAGVADITVNTNTGNVTGLDPYTDYSFTVVSVKDGVEQSSANTSTKTLKLPAATNFAASNVSTTGMTLSWDAVTSATGYKLVNITTGTSQTVTGTSVNLTGLTVDTQYQFELVTMYGAAEQEKTSTLTQSTSKLPAPSDITTTAGTNSIEFNWTPVSGADKYIIKNTETGTEYEVNNLPYTITGLDPNTTYNYEVYSYKDGKKQNKTTVSPVTTNKLPAATNFAASNVSTTGMTLSWDAVTGATGYKLVNTTTGDTLTVTGTSTNVTGLSANTEYEFELITMFNDDEQNKTSLTQKTLLPAPTNLSATPSYTSVQLDWTAVEGATSYIVRRAGVADITVNTNTCNVTGLDPFTDYSFTVVSVKDGVEQSSANTSTKTLKLPAATNLAASNISSTGATISWDAVTSATGYKLVNSKTSEEIATITAPTTSYNMTGLTEGTEYEVKLVTMYNSDEQNETSPISFTTEFGGVAKVNGITYATIAEAIAAAGGNEITILQNVAENITISGNTTINGNNKTIGNILINKTGNLELTGNLTAGDFILKSESKGDYYESGQYYAGTGIALNLVNDAYIDITLDPSGTGSDNKWYSFTVPFPVDSRNGIYTLKNDVAAKAVWFSNYAIVDYNGASRAAGQEGWNYVSGTLTPGCFYQIGTDATNTFRFKKTSGSALVTAETSYTLQTYPSANVLDAGWNGVGNNALYHVKAAVAESFTAFVQVYINGDGEGAYGKYSTKPMSEIAFNVAAPFFVQYATGMGTTLSLSRNTGIKSVSSSTSIFDVRIAASGATTYGDRLFVSASTEATDQYEIGYDVAKMGALTNSSTPLFWVKAYNTNLSVCRAPFTNNVADFVLGIYAPANGNYTINVANEIDENISLYLTYNNQVIADLSSPYTLSLNAGNNSGYGLRIVMNDITTLTENSEATNIVVSAQNGQVTISNLNIGDKYAIYDITGKILASGIATGVQVVEQISGELSNKMLIVKVNENKIKIIQ